MRSLVVRRFIAFLIVASFPVPGNALEPFDRDGAPSSPGKAFQSLGNTVQGCPDVCGSGLTITQHGGPTDRYLRLEATPGLDADHSYAWQRLGRHAADPFTPYDGLSDPTRRDPTVNRMVDRAYQVFATPKDGGPSVCACTQVDAYQGSFPFMVIADPQLGFLEPKTAPYLLENRHLARAVDAANRLRPAFVAIVGDMVQSRNNTTQRDFFFARMDELDASIPRVLVAGNHELSIMPTQALVDAYRTNFGIDDHYAFSYASSRFFVINSTLLNAPKFETSDPAYWAANGQWVKNEVANRIAWLEHDTVPLPGEHHRFVLAHHPLFLSDPDEPDDDGNDNVHLPVREKLLSAFRANDVTAAFSGHLHKNRITLDDPALSAQPSDPMVLITTERVGDPPISAGFRIVQVYDDRIEHDFHLLRKPPQVVDGAAWRYLDNVPSQGAPPVDWMTRDFDDEAWASGTALLGYGAVPDLNTTVANGGLTPSETVYFRHAFELDAPNAFTDYDLDVLRDDGAVVYVNGAEVGRPNMPGGSIVHGTTATSGVPLPVRDTIEAAPTDFVAGRNVLAVEVHQAAASGGDLAFDLTLTPRNPAVLVEARSVWRFVDIGDAAPPDDGPQTKWFQPGYGGAFSKGQAPLGDPLALGAPGPACGPDDPEDCGVTTMIGDEPTSACGVPGGVRPTVYVWQQFEVDDPNAWSSYSLHLRAGDGAVVYLNGNVIGSPNLSTSQPTFCTLADSPNGVDTTIGVTPSQLVPGINLVAVEVHRASATIGDLFVDLSLEADTP